MQLNPARGRKLRFTSSISHSPFPWAVYAAQPREGTETGPINAICVDPQSHAVYAAQPREGTETVSVIHDVLVAIQGFMQLNPARGRKLVEHNFLLPLGFFCGLCSSTPRGDGNLLRQVLIFQAPLKVYAAQPREGTETLLYVALLYTRSALVYAAQPREGTETNSNAFASLPTIARFMQLNPARGRKLLRVCIFSSSRHYEGLCSSTPRGDGNFISQSPITYRKA